MYRTASSVTWNAVESIVAIVRRRFALLRLSDLSSGTTSTTGVASMIFRSFFAVPPALQGEYPR
jgi:hypothetical protein